MSSEDEEKADTLSPTPPPNQHRNPIQVVIPQLNPPQLPHSSSDYSSSEEEENHIFGPFTDTDYTSSSESSEFQVFEVSNQEIFFITHRTVYFGPYKQRIIKHFRVYDLFRNFLRTTTRITFRYY